MQSPETFYKENIDKYGKTVRQLQDRLNIISFLRLAVFLLFLVAGYRWLSTWNNLFFYSFLGFLLLFLLFVRIAFRLKDKKLLNEKLLFVNTNELDVLQEKPNGFNDAQQFVTNEDYSADLDIFGSGSLYHLLNRTTTYHGARQLATLLQQPLMDKSSIEAQQQAVRQLGSQPALRQLITAQGLLHEEKEGNLYDIVSWLQLPPVLHDRAWLKIVRWVLPLYNVAAIIFYFATDNYAPLTLGVLISWMIIGSFARRINTQHVLLGKKHAILQQYASILARFSKADAGQSALLQQQQQQAASAHRAIKKLSSLAALFDQRLNMLVILFLNSFFMYDIQCMWALENWKAGYKDKFGEWIQCVGVIECLNSLATFAFNYPAYQYPVVLTDGLAINARALAHPLIAARERIANNMDLGKEERLALVTGSNMSGKTTFLRTLGINIILAQCGAPVCAAAFSFTPVTIRTSIRVNDSLKEHTSYFMAELKRLKQIILHLQQSKAPVLVLIDEILRGTNSEDKTHGSEQFIKKLLQYNCLTLFATHDLTLSTLENELSGQVSNYCFESIIRDGELLFDYTLQRGVAKNRNASFLMQKMEII